ncbi:hypothetical protein WMF38_57300 [Sorangium sp. So ce118]
MLSKTIGGRVYGVEVSQVSDAGEFANGARGYTASVEIYRDGARIGAGQWDAEGFEDCTDLDGRPLDVGGGEQVAWEALAEMVRESLAAIPAADDGGLALAL